MQSEWRAVRVPAYTCAVANLTHGDEESLEVAAGLTHNILLKITFVVWMEGGWSLI